MHPRLPKWAMASHGAALSALLLLAACDRVEDRGPPPAAEDVSFTASKSSLDAEDVQAAIDEIASVVGELREVVSGTTLRGEDKWPPGSKPVKVVLADLSDQLDSLEVMLAALHRRISKMEGKLSVLTAGEEGEARVGFDEDMQGVWLRWKVTRETLSGEEKIQEVEGKVNFLPDENGALFLELTNEGGQKVRYPFPPSPSEDDPEEK